jgi:hypothetical protein
MDAKTKAQRANVLMTRYIKLFSDVYGVKPVFNRNVEKWAFGDMIEDLGPDATPTLEYYFTLKRNHGTRDFLTNYHEFNQWRLEDIEDEIHRQKLAEETKKRVEDHREKWQKP